MNFDHHAITRPNPIFLSIGPLSVHWYAMFIITGIILAVVVSIHEGKKRGIGSELLLDLVLPGVPLCILGARIYYVLFNLPFFLQNPGRIFAIHHGGLAIHGGIIVAGLFAWWYLKKKQIPLLPILDLVAVGFFIGQILGRFGNFMNQEAYGRAVDAVNLDAQREFLTSLFIPEFIVNGMFIQGNYHHPTFLYEVLLNIVGLLIAVLVLRRAKNVLIGEIAAFYAIWYSFGRIFIESLRTDSLMIGPLRTAQVISIATILVVGALVVYRRKNKIGLTPYNTFYLETYLAEQRRKNNYQKKTNKKNNPNKTKSKKK